MSDTENAIADSIASHYAGVVDDLIDDCHRLEDQVAELTRQRDRAVADRDRSIAAIAPWSVEEQPGRFTYMLTLPATVRVTTDVDLRRVYDYGIGGWGHRYFWYRNSPDDQFRQLPMHLESVDSEVEADQRTTLTMDDNQAGETIFGDIDAGDIQMAYGEQNLAAHLREDIGAA